MAARDAPGGQSGPDPEYPNPTGWNPNAPTLWRGGQRSEQWGPTPFNQSYGNYTGMYPSLAQQVGQALFGSVQSQSFTPQWAQSVLPPRQSNVIDRAHYNMLLGQVPDPVRGGYTARPAASRQLQISSPYVMNGRVPADQRMAGVVNNAGNPFIGSYPGLTGGGPPVVTPPVGKPPSTPNPGPPSGPGQTSPDRYASPFPQQRQQQQAFSPAMLQGLLGLLGRR